MMLSIMVGTLFLNGLTVERNLLPNGLTVVTVEAHKIPLVYGRIMVRAGSVFDPKGKEGTANVTSELLTRGTKSRNADGLFDAIESVGGALASFADEDYAGVGGRVLSKDLDLFLSLMADCVLNPLFDSLEVAKVGREVASQIKTDNDDPWIIGEVKLRELIFGSHPLNHMPYGRENSVQAAGRGDIVDFYRSRYVPVNAFIVLAGDFDTPSVLEILGNYFGTWGGNMTPIPAGSDDLSIPPIDRPKGMIVKKEISQAYIFLGFAAGGYDAPDWIPTRIMNNVLGGSGLTSRISTVIREKKGLAYSAGSYFARFAEGGYYEAYVQTKKESATEAISSLIEEISKIQGGVSQKETDDAKNYYIGHFPLTFDTYRELADLAAQIEIEDLGLDYTETFPREVSAVTADQVKKAAQDNLRPGAYYLVVVGDLEPADIKVEGIDWVR